MAANGASGHNFENFTQHIFVKAGIQLQASETVNTSVSALAFLTAIR